MIWWLFCGFAFKANIICEILHLSHLSPFAQAGGGELAPRLRQSPIPCITNVEVDRKAELRLTVATRSCAVSIFDTLSVERLL